MPVIMAACLALAALTLPVVPCSLPKDVWSESEFARVKEEVEAVKPRLKQLYLGTIKNSVSPKQRYHVVAKYAHMAMYRPLLGSWTIGWSREGTWAFGVSALPNMPHVLADTTKETFQVTPDTLEAFLAWARTAEVDADAGMYVNSASAAIPHTTQQP